MSKGKRILKNILAVFCLIFMIIGMILASVVENNPIVFWMCAGFAVLCLGMLISLEKTRSFFHVLGRWLDKLLAPFGKLFPWFSTAPEVDQSLTGHKRVEAEMKNYVVSSKQGCMILLVIIFTVLAVWFSTPIATFWTVLLAIGIMMSYGDVKRQHFKKMFLKYAGVMAEVLPTQKFVPVGGKQVYNIACGHCGKIIDEGVTQISMNVETCPKCGTDNLIP